MGRSKIEWTGDCGVCSEQSSRKRVWTDDTTWVEVCPRCESRFRRNGTFEIQNKRAWGHLEPQLRIERAGGLGLTRLSKKYGIPRGTLQWMLNNPAHWDEGIPNRMVSTIEEIGDQEPVPEKRKEEKVFHMEHPKEDQCPEPEEKDPKVTEDGESWEDIASRLFSAL